jgi:HAD superfamily hydrolase (TIGR01458 family)
VGGRSIPGAVLGEQVAALLFDLDGTLYTEAGAIPGAVDAIDNLRRRGIPLRFVTNTTRRPRRQLVERLRGYGFGVEDDEVFGAVLATAAHLAQEGVGSVAPFVSQPALEDLAGFDLAGGTAGPPAGTTPDAVLIGDLGNEWTPQLLNQAFRHVMDGARLIALQKGKYWLAAEGIELDAGPWVAALEYATDREAVVCGKPNAAFFHGVVSSLGEVDPDAPCVMVGDDVWNDVGGAQRAGLEGWLVRTGKFREDALRESGVSPDRVIASVATLSENEG